MAVTAPAGTLTMAAVINVTARQQLPAAGCRTVVLRSDKTNTATIWVGGSTVTTAGAGTVLVDLQPGELISLDLNNSSLLYVAAGSSQKLYASAMG